MSGPLDGVLVVDLSRALAGPHAAMMLGDLGARVIKVENPDGGDDSRGWGPPFVDDTGSVADSGESTYFFSCNRNKESVTADLKSAAGKDLLTRLVRRADVLVENFRTGVLDRLGFSVESMHELNPRLVVLSITGFGHDGPEGGRAGYDQIAQGEAGLMSLTGTGPDDPNKVGVPIGDLLAGMYGAYGAVAALHERDRTGRGTVVRTSLLASIVGVHAFQGTRYTVAGEVPYGQGNHHPSICPYGLFHCADGLLQIAVGSEGLWSVWPRPSTCRVDEPGFATNAERVAQPGGRQSRPSTAPSRRTPSPTSCRSWPSSACPPARCGPWTGSTTGSRRGPRGCFSRSSTRRPAGSPCPVRRSASTAPHAHEHTAPPTLGQHDESVRRWLSETERP